MAGASRSSLPPASAMAARSGASNASCRRDHSTVNRSARRSPLTTKGRVLSEKSFELFTKPVIKSAFRGEDASYAYGLWVSDTNAHTLLRHTGGMVAFSSAMFADVTEGFAAFASVNAARLPGGYRPIAVIRYALALLSAASRGQQLPEAPPRLPSPTSIKNAAPAGEDVRAWNY